MRLLVLGGGTGSLVNPIGHPLKPGMGLPPVAGDS
jgi:hypothetical protein